MSNYVLSYHTFERHFTYLEEDFFLIFFLDVCNPSEMEKWKETKTLLLL